MPVPVLATRDIPTYSAICVKVQLALLGDLDRRICSVFVLFCSVRRRVSSPFLHSIYCIPDAPRAIEDCTSPPISLSTWQNLKVCKVLNPTTPLALTTSSTRIISEQAVHKPSAVQVCELIQEEASCVRILGRRGTRRLGRRYGSTPLAAAICRLPLRSSTHSNLPVYIVRPRYYLREPVWIRWH